MTNFEKIKFSGKGGFAPPSSKPLSHSRKIGEIVSWEDKIGELIEWREGKAIIQVPQGILAIEVTNSNSP